MGQPPAPGRDAEAVLPGVEALARKQGDQDTCSAARTETQTRGRIETVLCGAHVTRVLLDSLGPVRGLLSLNDSITADQRPALAARDGRCTARGGHPTTGLPRRAGDRRAAPAQLARTEAGVR